MEQVLWLTEFKAFPQSRLCVALTSPEQRKSLNSFENDALEEPYYKVPA